jgi:hypothetical protein
LVTHRTHRFAVQAIKWREGKNRMKWNKGKNKTRKKKEKELNL